MPIPSAAKTSPSSADAPRSWLDRVWARIAERGRDHTRVPATTAPPLERARDLAQALLSGRGEASGAALARELLATLRALGAEDRAAFHGFLATGFGPEPARLRAAAEAYLASSEDPERAMRLAEAAEPPRQELLRRMNMAPGGTAALVAMRRELLGRLRDQPELRPLEADLRHLLSSWFNRGFLELRRIDWQTPAVVLEKLIAYEAVHEFQGWDDLRRRLAGDRRCFGFFHPALPGEPLIFVQVALVEGMASAIRPLLERHGVCEGITEDCAGGADTAIFYSISNCQEGLRGISFGNFLIKQVVEVLKDELPQLVRFATLSPVPGFRRWLERRIAGEEGGVEGLLDPAQAEALPGATAPSGVGDAAEAGRALAALLQSERCWEDPAQAEAARGPLLRLCAAYLTAPNGGRGPSDPVARFHLGNGARLEHVNWLANPSHRGMAESYGLMVNYLYDPEVIVANHEAFARSGTVARSAQIDALLAPPRSPATPSRRPRTAVPAGSRTA